MKQRTNVSVEQQYLNFRSVPLIGDLGIFNNNSSVVLMYLVLLLFNLINLTFSNDPESSSWNHPNSTDQSIPVAIGPLSWRQLAEDGIEPVQSASQQFLKRTNRLEDTGTTDI